MKKSMIALMPLVVLSSLYSTAALADRTYKYPAIYPFVPAETAKIYADVKKVSEDKNFIKNFNEIIRKKLSKAKTKEKPWTSSYWPMNKGLVADPYENDGLPYYVDIGWVDWENNYDAFRDRLKEDLPNWENMNEEELSKLAPSEKYDILIGDNTFELTRKLWEYSYKWGDAKENAFTKRLLLAGENSLELAQDYVAKNWYSSVDDAFENSWTINKTFSAQKALELVAEGKYSSSERAFSEALTYATEKADDYVLAKKNSRMASWEGICNGWATAAGLVPRPRKSFSIQLPNGKNLKFYPSDVKALASLYYVNSLIQDAAKIGEDGIPTTQGIVSAGLRCNLKTVKTDVFGRKYDHKDDPFNSSTHPIRDSRCSGVHPATWHLGLVNLIGKQGRSFVVERKVGAAVDNHPMWGYEMEYFNPNSGRSKDDLEDNIELVDSKDQFLNFRNPKAKYIVGVKLTSIYLNYARPERRDLETEEDDEEVEKKMYYDLELDEDYNIVGGQWRAIKVGAPEDSRSTRRRTRLNHNQPDFFWTITKGYKLTGWFGDRKDLESWTDKSVAPPRSWLSAARGYHNFTYKYFQEWGNPATCHVVNKNTEKVEKVLCDQEYDKPQPLINVLNGLIELAK